MIVDTSALVAIILGEPDAPFFADALEKAAVARISSVNWMEAGIILDRQPGGIAGRELDLMLQRAEVRVEPVGEDLARIARQAYAIYGKGRHPAALNFADCFSYALAVQYGEPLLFKGNDFGKTDVQIVR